MRIIIHNTVNEVSAIIYRRSPLIIKIIRIHRPEINIFRIILQVRQCIHQTISKSVTSFVILKRKVGCIIVGSPFRLRYHNIPGDSAAYLTIDLCIRTIIVIENRNRSCGVGFLLGSYSYVILIDHIWSGGIQIFQPEEIIRTIMKQINIEQCVCIYFALISGHNLMRIRVIIAIR